MSQDDANALIEQQLDQRLKAIEDDFSADVFTFNGPLLVRVDDLVREAVEKKQAQGDRAKAAVILTTLGGYIEVVRRIVDTLRTHYQIVEFIVPNYAYSAGTVLVMSGDAIHMDYYSCLGPIDPADSESRR